jgi:REP element-mobilizing transposase RayT
VFTGRPERLKTFDYLGPQRYFLTFCTDRRHQAFIDREHVDLVHAQILRTSTLMAFEITAYCYMPDHLHLLVEGVEDRSDCREFISRAKQFTGFHYAQLTGRRLWQRYGYERTLRADAALVPRTSYPGPSSYRVLRTSYLRLRTYGSLDLALSTSR